MPEYLTMKETQDLLGVDEDTLYNLIQENKIRNYRIEREMKFKEAEVREYLRQSGAGAGEATESLFGNFDLELEGSGAGKSETDTGATSSQTAATRPVETPSAAPAAGDDIQFQDEEFTFPDEVSTQEITIVGAPATPAATTAELPPEDDDPLAVGISPRDQAAAVRAEERQHEAVLAAAAPRRQTERAGMGGGLLWAGLLAIPIVIGLVLLALMVNVAFVGFTNNPETLHRANFSEDGKLPEVGKIDPLWQEGSWFNSVREIVGKGSDQIFGAPPIKVREVAAPAPAAGVAPATEAAPETAPAS